MAKIAIIVFAVSLIVSGCDRGPALSSRYGTGFNADRIKRGMTILPDDWVVYAETSIQIDWANPTQLRQGDTGKPIHAGKQVLFDRSGNLVSEIDVFYSGKKLPHYAYPNETIDEKMEITYEFGRARSGLDPWTAGITFGPDKGEYDLDQAKAILKKWGIQY